MGRLVQDVFDYRIHSSSDPGQGILDAYRATVKDVTGFESADAGGLLRVWDIFIVDTMENVFFPLASVIVENIAQQLITPQRDMGSFSISGIYENSVSSCRKRRYVPGFAKLLGKGVSFQPVRDVFHKDSKTYQHPCPNKSSVSCDQIFKH